MLKFLIFVPFLVIGLRSEIKDEVPPEQVLKHDEQFNDAKLQKALENSFLNLSLSNIPGVQQGEITLKSMCERNGANDSFDNAKRAIQNIQECFKNFIKYAELPSKIEKSKPHGELDTVFKEYCQRSDQMKTCINNFLIDIEPCLAEQQKIAKYTIQNVTEAILRFVCDNEGDHIALFISEKGPECIVGKQDGIKKCIEAAINKNNSQDDYSENNSTTDEPFTFKFGPKQCKTANDVRKCIITELGTCSGSTPANVVDSIFNLVHNASDCAATGQLGESKAGSLLISIFSVIFPLLTIIVVHFYS